MALKDLFNNYFYGRPGKADFTEADLPANRIQLFFEVLKVRKGNMVGLNLLYLLPWLPAAAWTFINFVQLNAIEPEALSSLVFSYLLILFPLMAITGPFRAGISYVMRNWARDEHSFPFLDFKKGMKENWKQALLFSVIDGAAPLLVYVCLFFYSGMAEGSFIFYLPAAIVLLAAILWNLSAQLMPTMMVTYRLKFPQLVKNAVIITLALLPKAILAKLATLALPIIALILVLVAPTTLSWAGAIVLTLYFVFMLSFNKLITASYANMACEKYLNTRIEGAQTDIGLRPKDD